MKLSHRPALQALVLIGTAALLGGCRAQSTYVSQANSLIVPATTNTLTNAANPTNTLDQTASATVTNAAPPAATGKTLGEKLAGGEAKLSESLAGIINLAQGGVGEEVLLAYVQNHSMPFNLSPEEILYLSDLGISESIISAMIQHKPGLAAPKAAPATNTVAAEPDAAATNQPVLLPPGTNQIALPSAPSYAVTATPEFEAGAPPGVVATAPQVQYDYFYPALAPYGNWFEVPNYGMVWQPTVAVVDTSWRPYFHRGRWLDSDCGWYWHSDYSWGWAPFHYGRWCNYPGRGWLWVPGSVWGPSWVTWRYSDAYCGWAPLPPGAYYDHGFGFRYGSGRVGISFDFGLGSDYYTFIPTGRFCDPFPWRHRVAGAHVVNVFNRTTIINNYAHGPNKVIINEGVDRGKIAAVTRSEIRKVQVRDVPQNTVRSIRPDRVERTGSDMVVYKPVSPAAPADFVATRAGQELRKPPGPSANVSQGNRDNTDSTGSPSRGGAPRAAEGRAKTGLQPSAGLVSETKPSASSTTRIPSTRGNSTASSTAQDSAASVTLKSTAENRGTPLPELRTSRSLNASRPGPRPSYSGTATASGNSAATPASSTSQPREFGNAQVLRQADDSRSAAASDLQIIQTPLTPLQRRDTLRSTANSSVVVPSRPNSPASSRAPGTRPANDLETRLMEFQAANRAAPPAQTVPSEQPVFRTRNLTERSSAPQYSQPRQSSYAIQPPPSYSAPPSAYTPQPTPGPQYRQELPKTPAQSYPEKRSYSQPAPGASYEPSPGYRPSSGYSPSPSRGPGDYGSSVRSTPSQNWSAPSSGSITTVPSSRQGPPPTQISPSQLTPSPRSSSSSGNTVPSRSTSSGSGRQNQER